MKKNILVLGTVISFMFLLTSAALAEKHRIGVLVWHETPHDKAALAGFKEGFVLNNIPVEFDVKRASGDKDTAREIILKFKEEKKDLVCTVGTTAAKIAIKEIKDIPIVFTAVTNPVLSGISDTWQGSGKNVAGTSNWIPFKKKMDMFCQAVPGLKTLGVIYDPDNIVPLVEVNDAKALEEVQSGQIILKEALISEVGQIKEAVSGLIEQGIDALWVPRERKVYNNIAEVGKASLPANLPVVSSTTEGVGSGEDAVCVAGIAVNYNRLGRKAAGLAMDILMKKVNPRDLPVIVETKTDIYINLNVAKKIKHIISASFLFDADYIVKGYPGKKIIVAGTGDSQDLLRKLADVFQKDIEEGEVFISDSVGSSGGIKALNIGRCDLARVARFLTKEEKAFGLKYKMFAADPLVFVTHPDVQGVENITYEQIVGIYSGKIKTWEEISQSRKGKIYIITREKGDSSIAVIDKQLPGFADIADTVGKVFFATPKARDAVLKHKGTIGFVPLSLAAGTGLKILAINNAYPSLENVRSGKYLFQIPYGIVYKGAVDGLAGAFMEFLFSDIAKEIMTQYGTVPVE